MKLTIRKNKRKYLHVLVGIKLKVNAYVQIFFRPGLCQYHPSIHRDVIKILSHQLSSTLLSVQSTSLSLLLCAAMKIARFLLHPNINYYCNCSYGCEPYAIIKAIDVVVITEGFHLRNPPMRKSTSCRLKCNSIHSSATSL